MKKGFWAALAAIGTAIIAALLYAFTQKAPGKTTPGEKAAKKLKELDSKTDQEILQDYVTPAQKERIEAIVDSQVNSAMKDAEKFRRPRT